MASFDENQPLLNPPQHVPHGRHYSWLPNSEWLPSTDEGSYVRTSRSEAQRFLTSKVGHYSVLLLVSVDISCIFADFLINLYLCEHECGGEKSNKYEGLHQAQGALNIISLVFSCLFVAELMASIWAFGLPYFKSRFHCLDAAVIVAGFIVDVCLKGVLEEVGSTVVVLRMWRVFKIIEEFSTGAQEQMDALSERCEHLEMEKEELRKALLAGKDSKDGATSATATASGVEH